MSKKEWVAVLAFVLVASLAIVLSVQQSDRATRRADLQRLLRGAELGCAAVLDIRGELDGIADCVAAVQRVRDAYPSADLTGVLGKETP